MRGLRFLTLVAISALGYVLVNPSHLDAQVPEPEVEVTRDPRLLPVILDASVTPTHVHSGEQVHVVAHTTIELTRVEAIVPGGSTELVRLGPGSFAGTVTLKMVPGFIHGKHDVTFRAWKPDRKFYTQMAVPVLVN
jgi:hypothetical protein